LKNKCSIFKKTDNTNLVHVGGDGHLRFPTGTIDIYTVEHHRMDIPTKLGFNSQVVLEMIKMLKVIMGR
jgi:hypothetical protein